MFTVRPERRPCPPHMPCLREEYLRSN
nr:unnamed protein product [Callosobruchus chinensis]